MNDFNADLAHTVMDQIRRTPERHTQGSYRCETGYCFAGWIAALEDLEWASKSPVSSVAPYVLLRREDVADMVEADEEQFDDQFLAGGRDFTTSKNRSLRDALADGWVAVYVADYAREKLGLTHYQAATLFAPYNSRSQIEKLLKAFEQGDKDEIAKTILDVASEECPVEDTAEYTQSEFQARTRNG